MKKKMHGFQDFFTHQNKLIFQFYFSTSSSILVLVEAGVPRTVHSLDWVLLQWPCGTRALPVTGLGLQAIHPVHVLSADHSTSYGEPRSCLSLLGPSLLRSSWLPGTVWLR